MIIIDISSQIQMSEKSAPPFSCPTSIADSQLKQVGVHTLSTNGKRQGRCVSGRAGWHLFGSGVVSRAS
jgi:hypothetical protein